MSKSLLNSVVASDASPRDPESEIQALRRQLKAYVAEARQNEEKLKRFQALELRLIECSSLFQLLQTVLYDYRLMAKLDRVALLLYDPEYELRRILEEEGIRFADHVDLLFTEHKDDIDALYGASLQAYVGPYRSDRHERMFAAGSKAPMSVASLPMVRGGQLIGGLNLGSRYTERFINGTASDFLQRLASIVAVCLENVTTHERLKRVGLTDVLTGVNNRRFFDQRLLEEVAAASRSGQPLSCLFLDVDRFKQVNDTYGHQVGDQVLQDVAGLIRSNLRSSDVLARYGGEEFSALLLQTGSNEAMEIAERIRNSIDERVFQLEDGRGVRVTISIGAATTVPKLRKQAVEALGLALVERADQCVLKAKSSGRNRVIFAALT